MSRRFIHMTAVIAVLLIGDLMIFSNINTADPTDRQRFLMIGYALLGHCFLFFRWKAPEQVFLLVCLHAICGALLSKAGVFFYLPFFGPLAALHTVAARASLDRARAALVVAALAASLPVWKEVENIEGGRYFSALVGVWLFYQLCNVGVWYAGRWGRRKEAAIGDERRQLSRELHDSVGNAVTLMMLQAAGARQVLNQDLKQAAESLEIIEERGQSAMKELRRMLALMEPDRPVPAGPPGGGLADLDNLLDVAKKSGVSIRKEIVGMPTDLDDSVDLTAYRFVNEAVTNIAKHCGPGTSAVVRIFWSENLEIEVVDDGRGTPMPEISQLSTGRGLLGLRERVKFFGGELQSGRDGNGFRVAISIPLAVPGPAVLPRQRRSPGTSLDQGNKQ